VSLPDDDGYRLWLRYDPARPPLLERHVAALSHVVCDGRSPVLDAASAELERGLSGLLARPMRTEFSPVGPGALVLGTPATSALIRGLGLEAALQSLGDEGFLLRSLLIGGQRATVLASNGERGVLYGAFHLLRLLLTGADVSNLDVKSAPRIRHRLLNHWDNLDRTVERGYAGFSRWNWHLLPDYLSPEYTDYARAAASVGINGSVLTNVNANALVLTPAWLDKVSALASALRPYGIRAFLTARFNAPVELGELDTADPLDTRVRAWWRRKAEELYERIPDFGGLLVKANSEGQPGPGDYGRSHAEGANLLAEALAPHGGIVFWRAFVYSAEVPDDRAKQAYDELTPLDGHFADNVIVQVKNGPVDFQPREPFHPLFGAMPRTPLALELELTKEYLGHATHLVYLGPLFEECLRADTHAAGAGSTVARVVDGSLHGQALSAIAGVANIGTDRNWCGHPFDAANLYAFGRFAWDPALSSAEIAEEWLKQTFTSEPGFVEPARQLMLDSRETCVRYMTPLGLHHLMARSHHYGPGPWVEDHERPDWTSVYFHRADREGIGFDRSPSGSNAVGQYRSPLRELWGSRATCPEALLLWFHRVGWDERLQSGRTLWEELCHAYYQGAREAGQMRERWDVLRPFVDEARFTHVATLLAMQEKEARWWRDACVLYFQTFARQPLPAGLGAPAHDLAHYVGIEHRYVPGI
jgi:alpha-glucuronidase